MAKKMKPCAWCGKMFRQIRANHLYCCQACHNADHYSAKNKPILEPLRCPHNEHLICEVHSCSKCGWSPEVGKRRLAAIIAKMKEGSEGSAAGGGKSDPSEWQRSAGAKPASTGEGTAGHRNRKGDL